MRTGSSSQEGTFVFEVLVPSGIAVYLDIECKVHSETTFRCGDLVSVDLIEPSRTKGVLGNLLRLNDGIGWIREQKGGGLQCKQVLVSSGLWGFYAIGNFVGVQQMRHPVHRKDMTFRPSKILWPLQKVYCDAQVKAEDGSVFYRVQGTKGWVDYKRAGTKFLYPESLVSEETRVYRALEVLNVRSEPTTDTNKIVGREIRADDMVAVSHLIVTENENGDGPFVRLADNSGWLFLVKDDRRVMDEVPTMKGRWELLADTSIPTLAHPTEREEYFFKTGKELGQFSRFHVDRVVQTSNGVRFYRIEGTTSWVPDKRCVVRQRSMHGFDDIVEQKLITIVRHELSHAEEKKDGYGLSDNLEEEWAVRKALTDLEDDYTQRKNLLLKEVNAFDTTRYNESLTRARNEKERVQSLAKIKKSLDEENFKLVSQQMQEHEHQQNAQWERKKRGDMYRYELKKAYDISFSPTDALIGISGDSVLALNENNILRFSAGVPYDILCSIQHNSGSSQVTAQYVAFGSKGRYYIRFSDTKADWNVKNERLKEILARNTGSVEFVTFGATSDSFVVKTTTEMLWCGIPKALETIIESNRPIQCVNLGPTNEFFVSWKDGSCTGGNWGQVVVGAIQNLKRDGWHCRNIQFGPGGTFIIRYSDYSGPY